MKELSDLRKQIDQIDKEIISLLKQRMAVVAQVGSYKKERGIAPLDETRFAEVLVDRIAAAKEHGLPAALIEKIWTSIHNAALEIEKH